MSRHHPYETKVIRISLVNDADTESELNEAANEGWRIASSSSIGDTIVVLLERPVDRGA